MFNPLTPAEVVVAIGRAARDGARTDEPTSDFSRGQLMSAYSASRHLAVELASFGPELQSFATAAAACTRARPRTGAGDLSALADRLEQASDARAVGATVCELLESLRGDPDASAAGLRREIRSLLRRIADREVDLLADVIEAPKP